MCPSAVALIGPLVDEGDTGDENTNTKISKLT
jgi:hypothetical protein